MTKYRIKTFPNSGKTVYMPQQWFLLWWDNLATVSSTVTINEETARALINAYISSEADIAEQKIRYAEFAKNNPRKIINL